MLITSGNREKANALTASWCGLGFLWGKNVAFIFIRKSRYTKEFIDKMCIRDSTKEERDKIICEYTESSIAHKIIDLLDKRDQNYNTDSFAKSEVKKLLPNAAHAIEDASKEDRDYDEDSMDGDDF